MRVCVFVCLGGGGQLEDREAKKKKKSILDDFKQACHNSARGLELSVSPH